jgi:hypothetical protein
MSDTASNRRENGAREVVGSCEGEIRVTLARSDRGLGPIGRKSGRVAYSIIHSFIQVLTVTLHCPSSEFIFGVQTQKCSAIQE